MTCKMIAHPRNKNIYRTSMQLYYIPGFDFIKHGI